MQVGDPELRFLFQGGRLLFDEVYYEASPGTTDKLLSYYRKLKQAIAERAPHMFFEALYIDRYGATALFESGYITQQMLEQSIEGEYWLTFIMTLDGDQRVVFLEPRLLHDDFEFVVSGVPYGRCEIQELEELEESL